ncbi:MAG TPA: hypothetical protein PKG54_11235 [Phycisphaerae bacterium]|jgi:hypothetical protein|nr:hypothetical protein [Phycisphaerae bacterium]HOB75090.1 hypothetical protein [Phycisphaerae bacterium]HOJ53193.1 hypothetical protein [Phycisphaerae bacterium]HOL25157.1 hypothetical protein [Phycisphaerae bacterium]HPP20289.1 hypothetical protein [Phycisphaerae bacterium]
MKAATFSSDATPPLGHPLCGGWITPAREIVDPQFAKGVVLVPGDEAGAGSREPVVLCAVDWCWIRGECHERFREALAEAAGTRPNRVAVQTIHVHDAVMADLEADRISAREGHDVRTLQPKWFDDVVQRCAAAVREAARQLRPVSHIGTGEGVVSQVACNRRVLGPDGKVKYWRGSSCKDAEARKQPEGVIDPKIKCITLYDSETLIAALYYYATHPMSYYGQGGVSADFVGMARKAMEKAVPGAAHIYFTGCSGNVAAGKYNDGAPANRPVLAERMRVGMEAALKAVRREPLRSFDWRVESLHLPMREEYSRKHFEDMMRARGASLAAQCKGAMGIADWDRYEAGKKIDLPCLRMNRVAVLHLPGEPFIEYQLAAQEIGTRGQGDKGTSGQGDGAPGRLFVAVAGYGDAGPAYIPLAKNFTEGGYEVGMAWRGPGSEAMIMGAMERLLRD